MMFGYAFTSSRAALFFFFSMTVRGTVFEGSLHVLLLYKQELRTRIHSCDFTCERLILKKILTNQHFSCIDRGV